MLIHMRQENLASSRFCIFTSKLIAAVVFLCRIPK